MILILSECHDQSTNNVIEWLIYKNKPFERINYKSIVIPTIRLENSVQKVFLRNNKTYDLEMFRTFWYRRGNISLANSRFKSRKSKLKSNLNKFYSEEVTKINDFIHHVLLSKNFLNKYEDININKLVALNEARKLKLKIPQTLVTSTKAEVIKFIEAHSSIISKAMHVGLQFQLGGANFYTHTMLLNMNDVLKFEEQFNSTMFQAYIDKAFEIRIFYLKGVFYTSAIFSQNDEKTKIDFRNYNKEKPNRIVPFNLKSDIKAKLNKLMINLKLNSGSIDMIVTKKNEYVFLEVNPIGQFTQFSINCNFNLEEAIADIL